MKEKFEETKNKAKVWWDGHKDRVVKLGLAGSLLYTLGYLHAANKIFDKDKVYMTTQDDKTEGKDISFVEF